MNVKGKRTLVIGLGISGIAAVNLLHNQGAIVVLNDTRNKEQLADVLLKLDGKYEKAMLGLDPKDCLENIDLIVMSPGVDFNTQWVTDAENLGIKIVAEMELAYWYCNCDVVAITGTNGKTTTTSLVGEIFKNSKRKTFVLGNIGISMSSKVEETKPEDIVVAEIAGFQIMHCEEFAPTAFAFLNLTEDHLDKFKTMERYANSKAKMLDLMDSKSFAILNREDEIVCSYKDRVKGKLVWFSSKREVDCGAFYEDGKIYINVDGQKLFVTSRDEIFIMGNHNLENALAAVALTYFSGVDIATIAKTLKEFKGVEHRLEYVDTINGVAYINDSKGTNPDAAIMAIRAMDKPTVLIAGGYDKQSDFTSFVNEFGQKIVDVVVMGVTADKIIETANVLGYKNIHKAANFNDAVLKAASLAKPGYCVLLSPACASWDSFKNFEERGRVFKNIVKGLK